MRFECFAVLAALAIVPMFAQVSESTSTYPQTVLADHPILYYRLGEPPGSAVVIDSSGHRHTWTYANNPGLGVPGLIANTTNTAVNFAAGDVVIPNYKDLTFVNFPFTIEAWVNAAGFGSANMRVFDKGEAGYPIGYGLDLAQIT